MRTTPTQSKSRRPVAERLGALRRKSSGDLPPDPYQKRAVFAPAEKTGGFVKCGNGFVRGKARIG